MEIAGKILGWILAVSFIAGSSGLFSDGDYWRGIFAVCVGILCIPSPRLKGYMLLPFSLAYRKIRGKPGEPDNL